MEVKAAANKDDSFVVKMPEYCCGLKSLDKKDIKEDCIYRVDFQIDDNAMEKMKKYFDRFDGMREKWLDRELVYITEKEADKAFNLPRCCVCDMSCKEEVLKVKVEVKENEISIDGYIERLMVKFEELKNIVTENGKLEPWYAFVPKYESTGDYKFYVEGEFERAKNGDIFQDDNDEYWKIKDGYLHKCYLQKEETKLPKYIEVNDISWAQKCKYYVLLYDKEIKEGDLIKFGNMTEFNYKLEELGLSDEDKVRKINKIRYYFGQDPLYEMLRNENIKQLCNTDIMTEAFKYFLDKYPIYKINKKLMVLEF